jgi:hypothetical protein
MFPGGRFANLLNNLFSYVPVFLVDVVIDLNPRLVVLISRIFFDGVRFGLDELLQLNATVRASVDEVS